jgi:hypothetical protein
MFPVSATYLGHGGKTIRCYGWSSGAVIITIIRLDEDEIAGVAS